jgi:hypothetical protein
LARIRYLKPDYFKDEDLAELPYWVRHLFQGLWILADRDGRLEDRIKRIKAEISPYKKLDVEKGLQMLSQLKKYGDGAFILRYEIENCKYIQILKWHKHQKPHHTEKPSVIPGPEDKHFLTVNSTLKDGEKKEGMGMGMGMEKGMGKVGKGEFVSLFEGEYEKLVDYMGKQNTDFILEEIDLAIGKNPKCKTARENHYYTARSWYNRKVRMGEIVRFDRKKHKENEKIREMQIRQEEEYEKNRATEVDPKGAKILKDWGIKPPKEFLDKKVEAENE